MRSDLWSNKDLGSSPQGCNQNHWLIYIYNYKKVSCKYYTYEYIYQKIFHHRARYGALAFNGATGSAAVLRLFVVNSFAVCSFPHLQLRTNARASASNAPSNHSTLDVSHCRDCNQVLYAILAPIRTYIYQWLIKGSGNNRSVQTFQETIPTKPFLSNTCICLNSLPSSVSRLKPTSQSTTDPSQPSS